jgi:hypothetical protein
VLNVFSESTIAITNSPLGIQVGAGLIASPGVGTLVIENNGVGLNFALDGTALLWFISIPSNPSAITGNGVDVDLRFRAPRHVRWR